MSEDKERPDYFDQAWDKIDGTTAWHLIERHADNWSEVGAMMDLYTNAKLKLAQDRLAVALSALHKVVDIDKHNGKVHESCIISLKAIKQIESMQN